MKQYFVYYNIKPITGIPQILQVRQNYRKIKLNYKEYVTQTKMDKKTSRNRLHNALLTLNFLNANEKRTTAAERHWTIEKTLELNQPVYFIYLFLVFQDRVSLCFFDCPGTHSVD